MADGINLAARTEREIRRHGVEIVVSEHTVRHAGDRLQVRELGAIEVWSYSPPLWIYELLSVRAP